MSGTMGKLGRAWVGAWVVHGGLHGWCLCGWCGGGGNCMCILPGLVVLDLGLGADLLVKVRRWLVWYPDVKVQHHQSR